MFNRIPIIPFLIYFKHITLRFFSSHLLFNILDTFVMSCLKARQRHTFMEWFRLKMVSSGRPQRHSVVETQPQLLPALEVPHLMGYQLCNWHVFTWETFMEWMVTDSQDSVWKYNPDLCCFVMEPFLAMVIENCHFWPRLLEAYFASWNFDTLSYLEVLVVDLQ